MRKTNLLSLVLLFLLAGCAPASGSSDKNDSTIKRYIDDEERIQIDDFSLRVDTIGLSTNNAGFNIFVTSDKLEKTELILENGYFYRESNGAKYEAFEKYAMYLENEIEERYYCVVKLPTTLLDENYQLFFNVLGKTIQYNFYYNPNNFFDVDYKAENKIIKTERVHKGDFATLNYLYECPDHLQYATTWVGESETIDSRTPITKNVTLVPVLKEAVSYTTSYYDEHAWVYNVDHVFLDKVCVLRESYKNKPISLVYSWSTMLDLTDLYLPRSLASISYGTFSSIYNLRIHYPGTQAEWNALNYTSGFGNGTTVILNSSFTY